MANQWHYQLFGEEFGPVSEDVVRGLVSKGTLGVDDPVRRDGGRWMPASDALSDREATTATAVLPDAAEDADDADDWYCEVLGQELGPLSFNDLLRFAESGELSAEDQIRFGAEGKWRRVGSMGRLVAVLPYQNIPQTKPKKTKAVPAPSPVVTAPVATHPAPPTLKTLTLADVPEATELTWFAWIRGVEYGPSSLLQLQQSLASGQLSPSDFVRLGPTGSWCPSSTVNEILGQLTSALTCATATPPAALPATAPATARVAPSAPAKGSNPSVSSVPATTPAKPINVVEPKPEAAAAPAPTPKADPPPIAPKAESVSSSSSGGYGGSSSYGGGSSSTWQSQAAKSPPKPVSKPRASSGGGMSFDFSAITGMFDAKSLGMGGGVIAAALLVIAFMYMPSGNGLEVSVFKQLHPLLVEFQKVREKKGSDAEVQAIASKVQQICPPLAASLEKRAAVTRPASQKLFWIAKYRMAEMLSKGAATRSGAEVECEQMLYDVSQILKLPMEAPKPPETPAPGKNKPKVLDVGT